MTTNYSEYKINDIILKKYDNYYIVSSPEQSIKKQVLDKINLILSNSKSLSIENIINIINMNLDKTNNHIITSDYMNLFTSNNITKYKLNKANIYNKYTYNKINKTTSNIPTELLLNEKQLYQMILGEVEKVNSNMKYDHYIVILDDNIFNMSIRFRYTKGELGKYMQKFNEKNKYDYFEIQFTLNSMYPFLVPTIQYIKPSIHIDLLHSIANMDIWEITNWNYTISLDSLIMNLGIALEPLFLSHILNNEIEYNIIDLKLLQLAKKTKNLIKYNIIPININYITLPQMKQSQNNSIQHDMWASGTGFGHASATKWDISKYIDSITTTNEEILNIVKSIACELPNFIKDDKYSMNNILQKYIINMFNGINLLDFNKTILLYHEIINIINIHINHLTDDFVNNLLINTKTIYSTIQSILSTNTISTDDCIITYTFFIEMIDMISSRYKHIINNIITNNIINSDKVTMYNDMITKEQSGYFTLTKEHSFYKKQKDTMSSKSIIRIISEISSLSKNLPNNWDSSVVVRMCKTNMNFISFIITGPKDTPYHNGIFEFNAYFPNGYPIEIPQVMIYTTDNGRVRFNPNLYACGKVCLSLLGTWRGEAGESWNPAISTFLQVIISIQSLILVDHPYFNEPGYEREIQTDKGKLKSKAYNENIRLETIRVAMIGMIENPSASYENMISSHFKLKKDEILCTVNKWLDESTSNKEEMIVAVEKLTSLL